MLVYKNSHTTKGNNMKNVNRKIVHSTLYLALAACLSNAAFAATPSSVTDNGNDGNVAANTIDDDPTFATRCSANGNDGSQWVRYDFGSAVNLSALKIAFYKGDQRQTYFRIQSSTNSSSWSAVVDRSSAGSSGSTTGLETFSFPTNVSARYFRIQGFGNTSNTWNSITDVEFVDAGSTGGGTTSVPGLIQVEDYNDYYGTTSGNTGGWQSWITKTVNLGNLSAGNHTIRINVTSSDFNINWIDVKKQASSSTGFDWDGWKVTLPVNGDTWYNNGNTSSAAEIQPAGCTDDIFDENLNIDYFWSDAEGLHFRVPMNLDGKTPNTSYIRSELRELHNWTPCGTTSEANWS